ncbi:MAG: ADP-forming succinate--CoA ligase subunit beta [Acidimicrobiales bacterium]
MDVFEYQGKQLLASFDVPTPEGELAATVDEAVAAAGRLGYPVVVKAQVLAGGRGKAGGVRLAASDREAAARAEAVLGLRIGGQAVERLWVERACQIVAEHYASFTLDRSARTHLGMLSARGGVDIEAVAAEEPTAVARLHVDPLDGLGEARCRAWVADAGLDPAIHEQAVTVLARLYDAYTGADATLVEVNPLVRTAGDRLLALDAKVSLDDNAAFRHDWAELEATQVRDPRERAAQEKGLQYVGLDGSVGIIANGAGLAMSTCDVVNQVGGRPANFLDIGGGASAAVMADALELVDGDPQVRSIFVNVFGGITKGEEVATGIVQALHRVGPNTPIVVRLDGTNATEGRAVLGGHASGRLIAETDMLAAARRAVALAADPGAVG